MLAPFSCWPHQQAPQQRTPCSAPASAPAGRLRRSSAAAAQAQPPLPASTPAADSADCWWGRMPAGACAGRLWCRPAAAAGRGRGRGGDGACWRACCWRGRLLHGCLAAARCCRPPAAPAPPQPLCLQPAASALLQMLHNARTALPNTWGSWLLLFMSSTSASTAPASTARCLMTVAVPTADADQGSSLHAAIRPGSWQSYLAKGMVRQIGRQHVCIAY
jgi:hypothetical protein